MNLSLGPSLVLHASLGVATIVSVFVVFIVVEPALFRRKYIEGTCTTVNTSMQERPSTPCSCGMGCSSEKPCLKVFAEFTVQFTDPAVRFHSTNTNGTELIRDKWIESSSDGEGRCTNSDCFSERSLNEESAKNLLEIIGSTSNPFACRVNVDASRDNRAILSNPEKELDIWMGLLTSWGLVYVILVIMTIKEMTGNKMTSSPAKQNLSMVTLPNKWTVEVDDGSKESAAESTKYLVHESGEVYVDFEATKAVYMKTSST